MATVQDYKRRIRSVRNTRKITRAMELVAAAKLRRAQGRIEAMRPYADTMRELIAGVGRAAGSVRGLPLLQQRETTSTDAARPAHRRPRPGGRVQRAGHAARVRARPRAAPPRGRPCAGSASARRAARRSRSGGDELDGAFVGFTDAPAYADAQAIAHRAAELFVAGEVDRVVLVYNTFVSALTQTVTEQEILRSPPTSSRPTRRSGATTPCAATSSSSPSPSRSSSGCCPSTSRRRSTARCSSRPRPSRARA